MLAWHGMATNTRGRARTSYRVNAGARVIIRAIARTML